MSLTWESLSVGGVALRALRHSSVAVGDNIYVYGGILEGNPMDDLMVFNTGQMHTLVLHYYLFMSKCSALRLESRMWTSSLLCFSFPHLDACQNKWICASCLVSHFLL